MLRFVPFTIVVLCLTSLAIDSVHARDETRKPNVIIILADDLGYSDLGCYGGEIETPHIDALAARGVRYTHFRNMGRCCPSRASLMTGCYPHAVEMGWMTAVDEHRPGYRGQLTHRQPTIAELFKAAGYETYMVGKWHLTLDDAFRHGQASNGSWPIDRGFNHSYSGLGGGGEYYKRDDMIRDDKRLPNTAEQQGWYYTHAITENAVAYLNSHDFDQPLFMYIAHYAPHRPMQAPAERIARIRDRYAPGYDALRAQRFERLRELEIIAPNADEHRNPTAYANGLPAWDSLTDDQRQKWIKEMATYAAMVEIMDDGIGQVIQTLKDKGELDNTLIIFLSDNGATAEGGTISRFAADLSNTPFQYYKKDSYNGGISSPLIFHWPDGIKHNLGGLVESPSHIIDIMPTAIEAAGVPFVKNDPGTIRPQGVSQFPFDEKTAAMQRAFYWEHQTGRGVSQGEWKLVSYHQNRPWQLFNLNEDPFERHDLIAAQTARAQKMQRMWQDWARKNNALPLETTSWTQRIKKYKQRNPDQDGID